MGNTQTAMPMITIIQALAAKAYQWESQGRVENTRTAGQHQALIRLSLYRVVCSETQLFHVRAFPKILPFTQYTNIVAEHLFGL